MEPACRRRLRRPRARVQPAVVGDPVRDLREAVQLSRRGRRGRHEADRRGRRPDHRLRRPTDVQVRLEADVSLPHRRPGDRTELRRRVQPGCQPQARLAGDCLHARDRRRHRRDRGQGNVDLGGPGARPPPAPDPAHQAGGRLHRAIDAAVLLPDPARHADRQGNRHRPARVRPLLRHRADRQPAHRARTEPLLPRHPAGERRQDRVDVRGSGTVRRRARAGSGRRLPSPRPGRGQPGTR